MCMGSGCVGGLRVMFRHCTFGHIRHAQANRRNSPLRGVNRCGGAGGGAIKLRSLTVYGLTAQRWFSVFRFWFSVDVGNDRVTIATLLLLIVFLCWGCLSS